MKNRNEKFFHARVSENIVVKEHVYYEISREKLYREFQENYVAVSSQQSAEH